jgi:2-dehydro-3-deoxyphosphogalactonate aldolase
MGILSGIEVALWDIKGKALNQPIYNLLGGMYHEKIRSYTYLYPVDTTVRTQSDPALYFEAYRVNEPIHVESDPTLAAERAAAYVKRGFTAIKLDPARPEFVPTPLQLPLSTLENCELVIKNVREAVGGKVDICIGTTGQMTTSSAIRLARRLEKFDPLWFEEPVPPENAEEMARVAHHTKIPVATGERNYTKYEFKEILQAGAAAILQFTLGSVGGFMEAKKVAGMAEAYYAQIAPHMWAGPVATMANVQLDVCSPNFLIQEGVEAFGGFHAELLKKPIRWEQGYIIPPTEPGLGVELNDEVVQKNLVASG